MKKIVEIIDKLKINPLFRMSQSSMELTHSNIWAWLFDILEDKQKFFDLFGSDIKYKTQDCHRELHHMDIIIASNKTYVLKKGKAKGSSVVKVDWDSPTLVIENKTKDLAKTQQLEKYRETINSKSKSPNNNFVIATLFEMPKIEKWSEMPYSKIRDNIKELLDKGSFLKKHKAFISEYINMLNDLVELSLILMRVNSGKYDFLSYDTGLNPSDWTPGLEQISLLL